MAGAIRIGIGGWTFEPWRGVFYPEGLTHKRELEFASRALTSIEINGTYYSTFKPDSWRKWRDETPDDFVFAVKGSRFCTNRRVLADAAESVAKFVGQGLSQLGAKLGPINWQFMATKKFDGQDFGAFLALLPREKDGIALRHAIEVRHPSFACAEFYDLARKHKVAIVYARDEEFPEIDEADRRLHLCAADGDPGKSQDRRERGRAERLRQTGQGLGQARRRLRLFHLRRQGPQPRRRPGLDQEAGLNKRK